MTYLICWANNWDVFRKYLYTEDFINLICLKLLPSFVIFYFAPVYDLTIAAIKYLPWTPD